MIAALCLNPCVDRMVEIDGFAYGGMNRILSRREDGSGKGVNVALAVRELGMDAACIGILPEENSLPVLERLRNAGCVSEFLRVSGSVRVNTKLRNKKDDVVTEINESGVDTPLDVLDSVVDLLRKWGTKADLIVMTGSLPPGCPSDTYARLIQACDCRCVLDAEGDRLTQGLTARPFLIKPNRFELEVALGRSLPAPIDVLHGVRELVGEGMACVSMGSDGAVFSSAGKGWYAPRVPIQALSTVGAGDCMVAGMLYALQMGADAEGIFRCGVAGGTAGCLTPGTMLLRRENFFEQIERVRLEKLF